MCLPCNGDGCRCAGTPSSTSSGTAAGGNNLHRVLGSGEFARVASPVLLTCLAVSLQLIAVYAGSMSATSGGCSSPLLIIGVTLMRCEIHFCKQSTQLDTCEAY